MEIFWILIKYFHILNQKIGYDDEPNFVKLTKANSVKWQDLRIHTDDEPRDKGVIVQLYSGAPTFQCHHQACQTVQLPVAAATKQSHVSSPLRQAGNK